MGISEIWREFQKNGGNFRKMEGISEILGGISEKWKEFQKNDGNFRKIEGISEK